MSDEETWFEGDKAKQYLLSAIENSRGLKSEDLTENPEIKCLIRNVNTVLNEMVVEGMLTEIVYWLNDKPNARRSFFLPNTGPAKVNTIYVKGLPG